MFFLFTCGQHSFNKPLKGGEGITVQCPNCHNHSAKLESRWEWFTVCFVPLVPFSLKPWHEVHCNICQYRQDIKYRPDVQQMLNGGQPMPMQP
ncbi:hypothetical protein K470DRAFT_193012, partial [Piedraia hortae CBS 480.64]